MSDAPERAGLWNVGAMLRAYSLRRFIGDAFAWVVVFGSLFGLTFLSSRFLSFGLAIAVAFVLGLVWLVVCFLALAYEEDWWNDFAGQHTMMLICALSSIVSPIAGVWLGAT